MGQGNASFGQRAEQSGLGDAARNDESELHDQARSVVEGVLCLKGMCSVGRTPEKGGTTVGIYNAKLLILIG